jgi:hypothetical protein
MGRPSRAEKVKLLVGFYMISPDCHAVLSGLGWHGGSWPKEFADFDSENQGKGIDVLVGGDTTLRLDVREDVAGDFQVGKPDLQLGNECVLSPFALEAELGDFAPDKICVAIHTQFLLSYAFQLSSGCSSDTKCVVVASCSG